MQRSSLPPESAHVRPGRIGLGRFRIPLSPNSNLGGTWLLLGLLAATLVAQLGVSYLFLSPVTLLFSGTALTFVWLDGILTEIGLRRGLEEGNPMLNALRNVLGNRFGLISSRAIITALVFYASASFSSPHPLTLITFVFLMCTLSNFTRIVSSCPSTSARSG